MATIMLNKWGFCIFTFWKIVFGYIMECVRTVDSLVRLLLFFRKRTIRWLSVYTLAKKINLFGNEFES